MEEEVNRELEAEKQEILAAILRRLMSYQGIKLRLSQEEDIGLIFDQEPDPYLGWFEISDRSAVVLADYVSELIAKVGSK